MCLAIPLRLTRIIDDQRAIVESEGFSLEIGTALVPEARAGDYVLVHAGFALEVLTPHDAQETLSALDELVRAEQSPGTKQPPGMPDSPESG